LGIWGFEIFRKFMLTRLITTSRISFETAFPVPFHISKHNIHMESFTATLTTMGINELPSIPTAHPGENPLDIFRSHIAERLAPLAGVEAKTIFEGLDRSTKPETGDFVLAVPRLRIKGAKPQELSIKWQSQVSHFQQSS
jgi:hypothetical protein